MRTKASSLLERLNAHQITTIGDGDHIDGGGLQLNKRAQLGSWVYRFVSPLIAASGRTAALEEILVEQAHVKSEASRNSSAP